MKRYSIILFLLLYIVIISASCTTSLEDSNKLFRHSEVDFNYLIYMGADNNLERFALKNIASLKNYGSNINSNIIILFDRSPGYDKTNGNWDGTKLLLISKNQRDLNSDVLRDYGELDMTDPQNLYNFLKFVNEYFPARKTILNIWGHGRGVYPDGFIQSKSRGVIEDYSTGYGAEKSISIYDFANAIRQYEEDSQRKIDVIQFDACLMQMIEVCWQLRDLTDFIVGADTEISGYGSNYDALAEYMYSQSNLEIEKFVEFLTTSFFEYEKKKKNLFSICAVKTSELKKIDNLFNSFCIQLIDLINLDKELFIKKRQELSLIDTGYKEYSDLYEMCYIFDSMGVNCSELLNHINKMVVKSYTFGFESQNLKGIGINFPYNEELLSYYKSDTKIYPVLDFYKDTKWGFVVDALCCVE